MAPINKAPPIPAVITKVFSQDGAVASLIFHHPAPAVLSNSNAGNDKSIATFLPKVILNSEVILPIKSVRTTPPFSILRFLAFPSINC